MGLLGCHTFRTLWGPSIGTALFRIFSLKAGIVRRKKHRKSIEIQDDVVINSKRDASYGEQSPYWDDYNRRRTDQEHMQANPDSLPAIVGSPSTPQMIMGEAVDHLQGRQKEVYLLTMREDKSLAEVAEILNIEKTSVQIYKNRAIKFIEKYCIQAIAKGRV